jgi:hypothetical protein
MLARLPKVSTPVAGSPAARVTVRAALPSSQHQAALVQLLDPLNCQQPHLVGLASRPSAAAPSGTPLGPNPGNPSGNPSGRASQDTPLTIAAGQPVTLDWLVTDGSRAVCTARWTFTPQANRHYLAQGVVLGTVCSAALTDVTQADRPRTPEDLRYRTEPGKACVPLEQARRVQPGMLEGGQVNGEAVLRPLATDDDLKGLITP